MLNRDKTDFTTSPQFRAIEFLVDYAWTPDLDKIENENSFYILRRYKEQFYIWRNGKYNPISNDTVKQNVTGYLQKEDVEKQPNITQHFINNIILNIQPIVHIKESQQLNTWLDGIERRRHISFANGLLNTQTKELIPHTPNFFNVSVLPYNYEPNADYIQWEDFLLDVMDFDADRVILLQQWAGYLLMPNLRQQKFLLIAGDGANGKTTYLEIMELLLGRENVSHIPLAQFGERFALASTIGKLANISSESAADITAYGENVLKGFTSGDSMSFERKYQERIDAVPTAKVMVATNELPRIEDKSQGIWRRMIFVPFEKSYPEDKQDKNLAEKLSSNMSGIFNWALKGIELIKEYNGFITPTKCKDALSEYQLRMNPARGYLQENYICDNQAEGVLCNEVYKHYEQWCEANGFRPMNSANFGREVKRVFPETSKIRKGGDDNRFSVYSGIKKTQNSSYVTDVIANP
jgi:P4 family phage/plasmid primase-like protien